MPLLIVMTGPNNGDWRAVTERPVMVGRHDDCHLQIVDPMVSRRHFEVMKENDPEQFRLRPLSKTNGTQVNNREIAEDTLLMDDDIIRIGNTALLFVMDEPPEDQEGLNRIRRRRESARSTIIR